MNKLELTVEQFLEQFHDYSTTDEVQAKQDASGVKVVGEHIVAVSFDNINYCLMLQSALDYLKEEY